MNERKLLWLTSLAAMWTLPFFAQDNNIFAHRIYRHSPAETKHELLSHNPATHHLEPIAQDIALSWNLMHNHAKDGVLISPYEGKDIVASAWFVKGHAIDSTHHTATTGHAGYSRQLNKHTTWTNIADSKMFYPYITADSLGGDYHQETYCMGASWAKTLHKKLSMGAGASYKGQYAHRKRDPRAQNTSAQLSIDMGLNYAMPKADVGMSLHAMGYKQWVKVNSLGDNRKDDFFSFKGFGLYDRLLSLSGASMSRYYKSHALGAKAHFASRGKSGIMTTWSGEMRHSTVEDDAVIKPYSINDLQLEGKIIYNQNLSHGILLQVGTTASLSKRKGTEHHYDTVTVNTSPRIISYQEIYSAQKHNSTNFSGEIFVLYQHPFGTNMMAWLKAHSSISTINDQYAFPAYYMRSKSMLNGITMGGSQIKGNNAYTASAWLSFKSSIGSSKSLPDRKIAHTEAVTSLFAHRNAEWVNCGIAIGYFRKIAKRHALACNATYTHSKARHIAAQQELALTLTFYY